MTRGLRLAALPGLLLLAAALAGGSSATTATGPFYLVPSPTNECHSVKNCVGVIGPWVVVPARGEATFLAACRMRHGFIIGGTDARASSPDVRVWFNGVLGAPIGFPPTSTKLGAVLLFHATTNDGRQGWFQPTLGCVSLTAKTKRSTVSALPGTAPGAALDLRAENVLLKPELGVGAQTRNLRCPRNEKLIGTWNAVSFNTTDPPGAQYAHAVTITTAVIGGKVHASFHMNRLFGPLAPRISVQIGAMCQP